MRRDELDRAPCLSGSVEPCWRCSYRGRGGRPFQQVAFESRVIRVETAPGSGTGHAGRAALGLAAGGKMWLACYDFGASIVHIVRTGATGSGFGAVTIIPKPGPSFTFNQLQGEGSAGHLDLIANITVVKPSAQQELWHPWVP
jgi:hypothetical protein